MDDKGERNNEEEIENIADNLKDYYKNKEIFKFIKYIISINIKKILSDLNNYIESGDWKSCMLLINKLNYHRIFKYANEEYKKQFLDILIKKLLPNIYIYLESDVDEILEIIYYTIKYVKNYNIDWKFFYTLLYITNSFKSISEVKSKLFIKLHKHYSEDSITKDEYKILVRSFYDDLVNARHTLAFCNFIYFFPKKYLIEDDELQLRLLYFMQNRKTNFFDSCYMFQKIIRNNGKLYFSKDLEKNKEYIETFIKYYFTHLNLYILCDDKVTRQNYVSPIPMLNKDEQRKLKFEKSVISIIIELLFNPNFKDFYSLVEAHLLIILNNKHLLLKEKSKDGKTKNYINFLQGFLYAINRLFHDKVYDKNIMKYVKVPKKYEENKHLYDRLLIILKYLSLNLEKLFLYDNEGSCFAQRALFLFLVSVKLDEEYMKQVLENINFEAYIKMLRFFKEYSETRMAKYVMKLFTIMPILFSEYVFTNYPKIKELIKDSIQFLADSVSSANASVDIDILIIFCFEFFRIKDLSKKNKIYESLDPVIKESTEKIMNNILIILELVAKKNFYDFHIFILAMKKYLGPESSKKISSQYANYIENNEIESSNLDYYFTVINEEEHMDIFNFMYNNLLYVDDSNNIEINKNFIYPKYDKDFDIDISKCSIEIYSEKQLQQFQKIFLFFNYSKILVNDKMVKRFYELYFSLMNQKDKRFKKFGSELFGFVINSILECKVDEKTLLIEYPSEYFINIAIQMYEKIIIPYEKNIIDYIKNNPRSLKDSKNQEIAQEKKKQISEKQALEELFENYMRLMHKVNIGKCNIILNLNFEQENLDEYKYIQNQMKLYKKYKLYLKNSLEVIKQIFEYNGGTTGNYLFSNHNTNLYFDEILAIKIKENSQKIESRKLMFGNMNDVIFNSNLKNFLDIYMLNEVRIANIVNFEIIKLITPKEESYYTCMKLYLLCYNSVNHPAPIVSSSLNDIYSNNSERIKQIYNDIFNKFIEGLEKLKNDSLTEQNIMKNIGYTFNQFSTFYVSLFPYDSIDILEKYFKIISLLKLKKYRKIDSFIYLILSNVKNYLYEARNFERDKKYYLYYKKNEIIEKEMNKINNLLKENSNSNRNTYVIKHQKNIETFIENSLNLLQQTETDRDQKDIKYKNIGHQEVYLIYNILSNYSSFAIDKKSELFRKVIQFAFNKTIIHKSPVSARILWIKKICQLVAEEYQSYENYEWIIFKSDEEYLKYWNELKNDVYGKLYIPYPCERIFRKKYIFDEHIKINSQYNLNLEELLISMAENDEFEEDQKHIRNDKLRSVFTLDEVISKLVNNKFDGKKGLDFEKAKMFYYLFKLKYIDINSEYASKINFSTELMNKSGKKIKDLCVTYEFILGKYEYMLNQKLFGIKEKNELWTLMEKFTRRIDKVEDEKIYAFFHYIFKNYALCDLEFIFDYDYFKYPLDFVADMYYLFHINLVNLIKDTKIFRKKETEELIAKIFSTEENIILDQNYLIYIFKIYYTTNGMMNYNYYYFKDEYTQELCQHYMKILSESDTKYRRYSLYILYVFFFIFLNNDLNIMKSSLQKISLCINEFMSVDQSAKTDKGKNMLLNIEKEFQRFNKIIDFPKSCDMVVDILQKENDLRDTNKRIYLRAINVIYKTQQHLSIFKYSNQQIFDGLFKVFIMIKNEELQKNFSGIFLSYFNRLSDEENKQFIEKYQKFIFEDVKPEEEDINKYNYIRILMNQLLRFKIRLPEYMQEFIIKLKIVNKKDNNKLKKIIVDALKLAMKYYQGSYIYMKVNISEECKNVLEEMTKEKSYFV